MSVPTPADVAAAAERIRPYICHTPLKPSRSLSAHTGVRVFLKLESMQPTGSFKLRGATNALLSLAPDEQARGVVTCSSGNHGRAVAYVAQQLGVPAAIFLSELVPQVKVAAIRELGAEAVVAGADFAQADLAAHRFAEEHGRVYVHPYDDPHVIAGQGTLGLEILADLPEVDVVIVPLSGGGLLGGVALAIKAAKPGVRMIGVSMERGPSMALSLEQGRIVSVVEEPTLADALSGDVGFDNRYTFPLVRDLIDDVALLSEEEIAAGMVHALLTERLVLEGAGATPLALLLSRPELAQGRTVVAVCTGDNVTMSVLLELATRRTP